MAFTVGKTEAELQKQRAETMREIEARGGKAKAPQYAERLAQIDNALNQVRASGSGKPAPAGAAPGGDEKSLMDQRAKILKEIEARGGKDKAPNYAKRLEEVDSSLRAIRTGGSPATGTGEPFNAQGYLAANPDIAAEVQRLQASGDTRTPAQIAEAHWVSNGKAEGRAFAPTSTAPLNAANDPAPLGTLPKTIEDVQTGIAADKQVADARVKGQIAYGNPATESNPFGLRTVGSDENGRPVVTETLTPVQQGILEGQQGLSNTGTAAAGNIIEQAGLNTAFNPQLDPRIAQGDLLGFREKKQQELEKYLTRNFERDKARDLNSLETSLYNRGIPLDRQAEAYDRAIQGLNSDYDARYADASAQALDFGAAEAKTAYDMSEGTRTAQLDEQGKIRQQGISDVQSLSTVGSGLIVPEFTPFQGGTYDLPSPTEVQLGLTTAKQNADKLKLDKKVANAQIAAANRPTGGGSNGNSGSTAQSPFVDA